jgi:hypothetical protein
MHLPRLIALLAFPVPLAAQGNVLVVEDGAIDRGAVWMLDLNSNGTLESTRELADGVSGVGGLHDRDEFGAAVARIGDLDGNGIDDLAVGAPGESRERGAVWILFRAADGSVASQRVLRAGRDGLAPLSAPARFGASLAFLGDLDGDGTHELAIGVPGLADDASAEGELRIVSLASDGSPAREVRIADGVGGLAGPLDPGDHFAAGLGALGDLDGDGVGDLAVGAPGDDPPVTDAGAVWLLRLNSDATVASESKIGGPSFQARLGRSVCVVGDVDSDGVPDLAAGANDSTYVLLLNPGGTLRIYRRLGGYGDFGSGVAPLGDLDADGVVDLAVGSGNGPGLFLVRLNADGTEKGRQQIYSFPGLRLDDGFGSSLAALGDLDLDGRPDFAVGARRADGELVPVGDHTSLQAAVDAASSGDTLLLRDGRYGLLEITQKSLTVTGDDTPSADGIEPRISVEDVSVTGLTASQRVILARVEPQNLLLEFNAGLVWIEECERTAPGLADLFLFYPPTYISSSANVVLLRSTLGGAGVEGPSVVNAIDCTFVGADGSCDERPTWPVAVPGTPGLAVGSGAIVFLSGCSFLGGDGDWCCNSWGGCDCSGGGVGAGAFPGATVEIQDSVAVGGFDECDDLQEAAYAGPIAFVPGETPSFSTGPLAREGTDVVLSFEGPPRAAVWLMGSLSASLVERPAWDGWLVLGTPRVTEFMGTTDANGLLEVLLPLGNLAPGLDVRHTFLQPLMIEAARSVSGGHARERTSRVTLGAGSAFLVLDQSF